MEDGVFILRDFDHYASVTDNILAKNYSLEIIVLEQKVIEANYYISKQLNLPLASKVFFMKKIRVVEGKPRTIETIHIDYEEIKGLEDHDYNNVSFHHTVSALKGIKQLRTQEEILVVEATEEEKRILQMDDAEKEILLVKGNNYMENGKPFEYFEIASIPSFYRFRGVNLID